MAEARQNEMKVNITVVATKTLMAGFDPADVAMLLKMREPLISSKPYEDSIGGGLLLSGRQVRMGNPVVPAERIFIEKDPGVSHANGSGRKK